jgi:hypothetical protein
LTPALPIPKTATMNRSAALITVGFVGAIIGAVIAYFAFGHGKPLADPGPAKYVLMFGDSSSNGSQYVTVKNLSAFQNALTSPVPYWSTLQEVPSEGATPTPVPTPPATQPPSNPLLISRIQIVQQRQNNGACTMHVTQKVGLDSRTQVENILSILQPEATPSQ